MKFTDITVVIAVAMALSFLTACGSAEERTPVPAVAEIPGTWVATDADGHEATIVFANDGTLALSEVPALPLSVSPAVGELDWDDLVTATGTWEAPKDMSSYYPSMFVTIDSDDPEIAYGTYVGVKGADGAMRLFLYWGELNDDNKLIFERAND